MKRSTILFTICFLGQFLWSQNSLSQSQPVKTVIVDAAHSWNGEVLPSYPQESPQITLLKITIPPHSKLDWHKHPIINVGYMTKGSLTVTARDGSSQTVNCGEGIVELVNQYHYGENKSDQEAEIIVFYVGTKGSVLSSE